MNLLPIPSRSLALDAFQTIRKPISGNQIRSRRPWTCQQCRQSSTARLFPASARPTSIWRSAETTHHVRQAFTRYVSTETDTPTVDKPSSKRKDLPSATESRRSQLNKRFSHSMEILQSNIFFAVQRLNDLTGYTGIEALKKEIAEEGQSAIHVSIPYAHERV